ncbi:MAG: adenosylcobinamide-GDP ribazoletransferase, partial [Thermodesulfobacteriota bacterium]|nr:adenosylcobinamide-GDP ribazoletransferase [Thermodesulfobacteriota bacterium]
LLSLFAGRALVVLNLGFVVATALVLWFYKKRMGCITGDMIGAMIETVEVVLMMGVTAGAN